jgi:Flp pilus assembly protein TadD
MAHIYDETGDWRNAEKALLAALKLKPNEPLILNYLGYSWVDKGKNNEKALKMIEKAMIMMPMNPNIIDSLGWAYYKIGQHGKAVKIIKASLKFAPLNPTINYHLGEIYYSLGRFLEAKYQFEKAISYDKENELNKEVITEIEKKIKKINLKI